MTEYDNKYLQADYLPCEVEHLNGMVQLTFIMLLVCTTNKHYLCCVNSCTKALPICCHYLFIYGLHT